jgi:hypothetical protein
MNNKNDDMNDEDDGTDKIPQELVQCLVCLRRMRQEVFVKHPNVCRKNPTNKRNTHAFDMTQYRSVRAGDKIIPVRKVSPINTNKSSNIIARPSQTRSAKRDRRSDPVVQPVIDNFCTYIYLILRNTEKQMLFSFVFQLIQVVQHVNVHFVKKPMIVMLHFVQVK